MLRTAPLVVLLAAAPVAVAGCSGSSDPSTPRAGGSAGSVAGGSAANGVVTTGPGGVQEVTVAATNTFRFVPADIRAHVGMLRITLTDTGAYPHNISFPSLHATSATVSGDPGQHTAVLTVRLTHPGSYRFVCTFHSSAGMVGHVAVS